jgi:hypothetical protein
MRLDIEHPEFKTKRLAVETAGWFSGSKLLVNGAIAEKRKGRFTVPSDSGAEVSIELKYNLLDPIPKVKIGDETLELAPPLQWYEYAWIGIPILLVFVGGAIGGLVGAMGARANGRVFRGNHGAPAKYGISALITIGVPVAYIVLATLFRMAVEW